jgi:hypothetical protein
VTSFRVFVTGCGRFVLRAPSNGMQQTGDAMPEQRSGQFFVVPIDP